MQLRNLNKNIVWIADYIKELLLIILGVEVVFLSFVIYTEMLTDEMVPGIYYKR